MMNESNGSWQCNPTWSAHSSEETAKTLHLPASDMTHPRLIIGRREWITLPDLALCPLMAKADTGARTSTLHAERIHYDDASGIVHFYTYGNQGALQPCSCQALKIKHVRNSGGIAQSRVVIRTTIAFPGGFHFITDFTLADRSLMRHPILLGRRALSSYFVIDPQHRNLLGHF